MQYAQYVPTRSYAISDMTKKKIALSDFQKYELCLYARENKKSRTQYIDWIEQKWGVRVDRSTDYNYTNFAN